jgi:uncharacterized membrane protein YjjB (DUF3815 family)
VIIQVMGAFVAVVAFCILLEGPKKYIICCGTAGALGWLCFLLAREEFQCGVVMASLVSGMMIALLSHTFARIFKAPVTIFEIPGILPIVPGAGMYRIVYHLMNGKSEMANYYFRETIMVAGAIALSIFFMDAVFGIFQKKRS